MAATALYPTEPQAHYVAGLAHVGTRQYDRALDNFTRCDRLLPGNPQLTFYMDIPVIKSDIDRQRQTIILLT